MKHRSAVIIIDFSAKAQMRFSEWPATAEWYKALLVDRMEVNIGPAWYGTPEAGLFVTYTCTFMLAHLHTHTRSLSVTQSQVARLLTSSKGHNRAKSKRGTTGTEHLIMSASAVFVTQTAGRCYRGPGRNMQCKPCTLTTPLMSWQKRERDRICCRKLRPKNAASFCCSQIDKIRCRI